MEAELLEFLVCPLCKGKLVYSTNKKHLVCKFDQLAYPIRNNIPILLKEEAVNIKEDIKA